MFIFAHEIGHCVLLHNTRLNGRDEERWNIACDYVVNALLKSSGFVLPKDALYDTRFDGMNADEVYPKLPKNIGNTAKAITKGFSISAAALTVLALFAAFSEVMAAHGVNITISLRSPIVVAGVFLGAITPPLFSALTMLAVTNNAFDMIEEIRRQFHAEPGILAGTHKPDYARCVSLAAHGALNSLAIPAFLAVGLPLVVGFVLGPDALGGFLGGAIFTGVIFALLMSNAGGLWDNAKKYIETGKFGGPGSEAHKAAVVGDTVGDPFKDTAGPSLNTLITVMSLVSSLFAPIIAAFHLFS